MKKPTIFVLEKQYVFYKSCHSNTINSRIHLFFIPILIISALTLLAELQLPAPFIDVSRLVAIVYIIYGFILDPTVGLTHMPVVITYYIASVLLRDTMGPGSTVPAATALHMISWIAQFTGHFVFEKKSPAVMSGLVQAISAGPVVMWLSFLFSCGFLLDLKARIGRAHIVSKARKAVSRSSVTD